MYILQAKMPHLTAYTKMQSEIDAIVGTDKQIYSTSTAILHYCESKLEGTNLIQDGNKNPSLFLFF